MEQKGLGKESSLFERNVSLLPHSLPLPLPGLFTYREDKIVVRLQQELVHFDRNPRGRSRKMPVPFIACNDSTRYEGSLTMQASLWAVVAPKIEKNVERVAVAWMAYPNGTRFRRDWV